MRHVLANLATYLIGIGLVVGAAFYAWARSGQLVLATEAEVEPVAYADAQTPSAFDWPKRGAAVYVANCSPCHTSDGGGRNMYPPVQGMSAHLGAAGGRDYLAHVVVNGLWSGLHAAPMPAMPHLTDVQVAAVLNHLLTAVGTGADSGLYVPADVARVRRLALRPRDVGARRPALPPPSVLAAPVGRR